MYQIPTLYTSMGSVSVPVHWQIQNLPYKCLPDHLHWPVSEVWFLADVVTTLSSPLGHLKLAEVHSLQTHWDNEKGCLQSGCCILTKRFYVFWLGWALWGTYISDLLCMRGLLGCQLVSCLHLSVVICTRLLNWSAQRSWSKCRTCTQGQLIPCQHKVPWP